jgi:hypothetical protein
MNETVSPSRVLLAVTLLLTMIYSSAMAKVSAEEILCFQPDYAAVDEQNASKLLRLREKARPLGRLDGTIVTTLVTLPTMEAEQSVRRRGALVMARLEELGLLHKQFSTERFLTETLENEGCPKGEVPVQVTLMFAEPAYLKTSPPK